MAAILTTAMRLARCQPWLLKAIGMDLSFNSAYRSLMTAGISYRRTDMLRTWNMLKGFADNAQVIQKMYYDSPIPKVRHLYTEGKIGNEYRYTTLTSIQDPMTGEATEIPFSILSSEPLTFEQLEEAAKEDIKEYELFPEWDIIEVNLAQAWQRK